MRSRILYIFCLLNTLTVLTGCGQKNNDMPAREGNNEERQVTLVKEGEAADKIIDEKEPESIVNKLPKSEKTQAALNDFFEGYNAKMDSAHTYSIEKLGRIWKCQDGDVLYIEGDIPFHLMFLKPDELKTWDVNYYKDSDTGKFSFSVNECFIMDKEIEKAEKLYIYQSDYILIVMTEDNEQILDTLAGLMGEMLTAKENPF